MEMKEILEKANDYLLSETNEFFKKGVQDAIDNKDYDDLYDRFYTSLSFGTAGLRGVIGGGTNRINPFIVKKVSQGLAEYVVSVTDKSLLVIAYDSRNFSQEFAKEAALVLAANGVKVALYDTLHPVPLLSFAVRNMKADAGIVITASHNPAKYNGYKVYWSDGGQVTPPHDIAIANLANSVKKENIKTISEEEAREKGLLISVPDSVDEAYYEMVLSSLRRPSAVYNSPITVAYTPLHGSGNVPVREMLKRVNIKTAVVKEQEEPNGDFPTVKLPNPESAEAMSKVLALAKEVKADIVLGTDPDADRLGIAIPKSDKKDDYLLLTGNQIATLLADYLIETNKELKLNEKTPLVVKSLVTTDIVKKIAEKNGGVCKDVLTGFKYIAEKMDEIDSGKVKDQFFLFGCEESYGFNSVKEVHDKDAVSSAILAVEMMCHYANNGISLIDRLNQIYQEYGYSEEMVFSRDYEGSAGKAEMEKIMADFRKLKEGDILVDRKIKSILDLSSGKDTGFPSADVIIIQYESGEKLIVRPSGTEPKIKYYIFLTGDEKLASIKGSILDEFKARF